MRGHLLIVTTNRYFTCKLWFAWKNSLSSRGSDHCLRLYSWLSNWHGTLGPNSLLCWDGMTTSIFSSTNLEPWAAILAFTHRINIPSLLCGLLNIHALTSSALTRRDSSGMSNISPLSSESLHRCGLRMDTAQRETWSEFSAGRVTSHSPVLMVHQIIFQHP